MQLSELFTNLSFGVLSNHSIGGNGSGTIKAGQEAKLIHHINEGLTRLYGRFLIKTGEVAIRSYDGITIYPLEVDYADSDATEVDQKFIADTPEEPYTADIVKILEIYDEQGGRLPINDERADTSLYTPNVRTVQIPQPVTGNTYFIIYQAKHAKLVDGDLTQEIEVPHALVPALEAYVGHRVFSPLSGSENNAKAMELLATYTNICDEAEKRDLVGTSIVSSTEKFEQRGFV